MKRMSSLKQKSHMFDLIEQWQSSGMTQKSFISEHGINSWTFYDWLKKYRKEYARNNFLPVHVREQEQVAETVEPTPIEIHYPNKVKLVISSQTPIQTIKQLANL
jgi:transposase-like protein